MWIQGVDMGPLPKSVRLQKTQFKTARQKLTLGPAMLTISTTYYIVFECGLGQTISKAGRKQFTGTKELKLTQSHPQ